MRPEPLPPDEALLLLVRPEEVSAERLRAYRDLLDEEETDRLRRFRLPALQRQHLVTRALVRTALSRHVPVEPRAFRFGAGEHGCPFVREPAEATHLRFNLSHTRGLVACLLTRDREVGVDVEDATRAVDAPRLAERYFARAEAAALRALPEAERGRRFFTYWTLKEAYIKARGMGLALPLGQFAFEVEATPIRIRFAPELADDPESWDFSLLAPDPGHLAATAIRRREGRPARVVVSWTVP